MKTYESNEMAYVRVYSATEISSVSRQELEEAFMKLQAINEKLDFKIRANDAEKYVAEKAHGVLCDSIHSPYDVLSASRHKLEIKVSKLISPNKKGAPLSTVWKWNRLLGDDRNKVYDRLILVGLATKRAQDEDWRNQREPRRYEFFDFSFEEAQTLAEQTRFQVLGINTNRLKTHALLGRFVWAHHIEPEELVQRYSMDKKP